MDVCLECTKEKSGGQCGWIRMSCSRSCNQESKQAGAEWGREGKTCRVYKAL